MIDKAIKVHGTTAQCLPSIGPVITTNDLGQIWPSINVLGKLYSCSKASYGIMGHSHGLSVLVWISISEICPVDLSDGALNRKNTYRLNTLIFYRTFSVIPFIMNTSVTGQSITHGLFLS